METLDPRVRLVWIGGALVTAAVLAVLGFGVRRFGVPFPEAAIVAVVALAAVVGVVLALLRYRVWRFEVRGDSLYLVRGVLTRTDTSVPFVRVQHVDTRRGPVERAVGLASVVVYTAGTRGADITIPGLTPERARTLRERLRDLATESELDAV
ncbi:PH domain-containing protein [Halorarum halophilum]|uniref:PH domain-containing protein n=1 Tax=Halorarum halophilum TaxID=2743090 RepID=A0A7D5K6M2_9EURY|nr:PH domain-containing protein [Halobaculum halophilum]QLG26834.1 PH domain-containing protein [Halobaculum halophilum]